MNLRLLLTSLTAALAAASLSADTSFEASHVYSLKGNPSSTNRYSEAVPSHFEAGDVLELQGVNWVDRVTTTMKGIAVFDLEANGMRNAIQQSGDHEIAFSFVLNSVTGVPRPLRVMYIGTTNELNTDRSLQAQFQRQPIHQANRVLDHNAQPGIKVINATSLLSRDLSDRFLVIRFEQEGGRRQIKVHNNEVKPDLYVFNRDASTVKITITDKVDKGAVVGGYQDILPDMPTNLCSDMGPDPITDMPKNPIQDMPKNPIQDMPDNLLSDMPKNLINDGPVSDSMGN
ncbi:MAG: hypothetical protein ACQKBV_06875 [Puniceicoccales bacterium]